MAQTARKAVQVSPALQPKKVPEFKRFPGKKLNTQKRPMSLASILTISFVVVISLFVCIGVFSVFLSSQAVITAMETASIQNNIKEEKTDAKIMDVQRATITESVKANQKALEEIGMVVPQSAEAITLSQDNLALNEDGSLSLAESLNRLSNQG